MDRKNDDSRLLLEQVNDLLENNKILELRELLEEYHTMDILDVMEDLDEEMKVKLFEVLPIDVSASILEESGSEFFRINAFINRCATWKKYSRTNVIR